MLNLSNVNYVCCKTYGKKRQSLICSDAIQIEFCEDFVDYRHSILMFATIWFSQVLVMFVAQNKSSFFSVSSWFTYSAHYTGR